MSKWIPSDNISQKQDIRMNPAGPESHHVQQMCEIVIMKQNEAIKLLNTNCSVLRQLFNSLTFSQPSRNTSFNIIDDHTTLIMTVAEKIPLFLNNYCCISSASSVKSSMLGKEEGSQCVNWYNLFLYKSRYKSQGCGQFTYTVQSVGFEFTFDICTHTYDLELHLRIFFYFFI